jgi:hypothetical protein
MNTQLVDQHWFISLHGKRYGPYTFAALVEAAAKGVVTAETSVWRLGWQQWHPASQVPGLLAETPVAEGDLPDAPPDEADRAPSDPADDPLFDDTASRRGSARPQDARQQIDDDADVDAPPSRRRQRSADEDTPRTRDRQPSRDEDFPDDEEDSRGEVARARRAGRDDDETSRGPSRPERRPPPADLGRTAAQERQKERERARDNPRERALSRDDDASIETPKARPRRPAQQDREDDARDTAQQREKARERARDRWAPHDDDAPDDMPKPRNRRRSPNEARDLDEQDLDARDLDERDLDAPDLDAPRSRRGRALEDDARSGAITDPSGPRGRRPSRDADASRRKRASQDSDDILSPDGPRPRDRRPPEDEDVATDKARRRRLLEDEDEAPADGWGTLDVRPSFDDDRPTPRTGREKAKSAAIELDGVTPDDAPSPPSARKKSAAAAPARRPVRSFLKRAATWLVVIGLLAGAGWAVFSFGVIQYVQSVLSNRDAAPKSSTSSSTPASLQSASAPAAAGDLPSTVANLPAVVALSKSDPASFARFKKRFAASAANAQDDELLSLARAALRKSVKRALANSPGDTLLEITEAYLAYMQGLQSASPESCVALSDESKGAKLTINLAKQFPIQFIRDMSVLERVASTSPTASVTPLTADQARPFLETVFNHLRQQPVKSELLGRDKLTPAEFEPYCTLVIAFYQAVLELPRDDKVNLLRYLYATAATDPDSDLAK